MASAVVTTLRRGKSMGPTPCSNVSERNKEGGYNINNECSRTCNETRNDGEIGDTRRVGGYG